MCRMILASLRGGASGVLPVLLDALREIAGRDPLLDGASHGDGWGGVAVAHPDYILEMRSGRPVYDDPLYTLFSGTLERLGGRRAALLVHVRRAGRDQPRGLLHVHPYVFHLAAGTDVWLAFNGSVDMGGGGRTDAYALAERLVSMCRDSVGAGEAADCIISRYRGILDSVRSGGNLALLAADGDSVRLCLYPLYRTGPGRPGLRRYYTHYLYRRGESYYVLSSSIVEALGLEASPLQENTPVCIDID